MALSSARVAHVADSPRSDTRFFGHPKGLSTLFFTEMWERFSYYGMRGFLILYMTAAVNVGGLGLGTVAAGAIYGTYTSMVYLMSLPGGWLADRILGQRRAVLYGGILIACGHYTLAVRTIGAFYLGLVLIVLGTGLLKPNISVIVGQLYGPTDQRRDAGFSLFYMGINLGAFLGPLVTGYLAQDAGFRGWLSGHGIDPNAAWHWGFAAAGVGMTFGLVQYFFGSAALGDAGVEPASKGSTQDTARARRQAVAWIGGGLLALAAFAAAIATGALPVTPEQVTNAYGYVLLAVTIAFFVWLLSRPDWAPDERKRLYLIGVLFVASAVFWSVFEQAGSTLNLFADRSTRNSVFGHAFPSSWFQSVNAIFIVIFAPAIAWLWIKLGARQPASPTKFSFGLVGVGLGFLILVPAARASANGAMVSPMWLTATYFVHTIAELCLSPVGLSSMTKLAPSRIASLVMGVWFLSISVGDFVGGQAAGFYESMSLARLFGIVGLLPIAAGIAMFLFRNPLTRLIGDESIGAH